jgi:hypothetical protein
LTNAKIKINNPTKTTIETTPIMRKKIPKSNAMIPATLLSDMMVSAAAGSSFSFFDHGIC